MSGEENIIGKTEKKYVNDKKNIIIKTEKKINERQKEYYRKKKEIQNNV